MRIGIHTSTSKSLESAALKAHELGADALQIFSASPRMWRASVPDPADIRRMRQARDRFDLRPLAIHVNYLVNLATIDPAIREKSIVSFRGELDRAAAIGADYLVLHPGSYRGQTPEEGMEAFSRGLAEAARGFHAPGVTVLLENTVGSGCLIGAKLEELNAIRRLATRVTDIPIAYCLDTCHLFAAGFDIATGPGLTRTINAVHRILTLDLVPVIHTNDSKGALGSKLDRHRNIGQGEIGERGFRRILRDPALRDKAFILETPVDEEGDDRMNVETVKRLARTRGSAR